MAFREVLDSESWGDWSKRNVTSTALRLGQSFESIPQALIQLGQKLPDIPGARKRSPQELSPIVPNPEPARTGLEETIQGTIANLPLAYLLGGAKSVIPLVAGQATRGLTHGTNLSELARTGIQLGTELGTGAIIQKAVPRLLSGQSKEFFNKARAVAPANITGRGEIDEAIKFADRQIRTASTSATKDTIREMQQSVDNLFLGGKADPVELWELQSDMYKNYRFLNDKEKLVSTNFTKSIGKTLENSGMEHPEFWENLSKGKQIETFRHMDTVLGHYADDLLSKLPITGKAHKIVRAIGAKPFEMLEL